MELLSKISVPAFVGMGVFLALMLLMHPRIPILKRHKAMFYYDDILGIAWVVSVGLSIISAIVVFILP